ncbi:hypothetical protein BH10ACT7_BH10ACT7_27970 [soil metagenome]
MRRWGGAAAASSAVTALAHLLTAAILVVDSPFLALVAALMALNCGACAWHARTRPGARAWAMGAAMSLLMLLVHAVLLAAHGGTGLPSGHHGAVATAALHLPFVDGLHWLTLAGTVTAVVLQSVLVATSLGLGLHNQREHEQWHRQTSVLSDSR